MITYHGAIRCCGHHVVLLVQVYLRREKDLLVLAKGAAQAGSPAQWQCIGTLSPFMTCGSERQQGRPSVMMLWYRAYRCDELTIMAAWPQAVCACGVNCDL